MKKKKTHRSTEGLTRLDDFLKEEEKLEKFEAVAIKEELGWQIAEAMKAQNLARKRLAERMKTSPVMNVKQSGLRMTQSRHPDRGREGFPLPALRTVRAVFPHTALQSVVSSSGASRSLPGCV
jgi:hypothetical protein